MINKKKKGSNFLLNNDFSYAYFNKNSNLRSKL